MNFEDYLDDFKDYKMGSITCDECMTSIGSTTGDPMEGHLCDDCFNELEEYYKSKHPEEYE